MDGEGCRAEFRGSAMERARLPALTRNAAMVPGDVGSSGDVPMLVGSLAGDEPLVRGPAAGALGRIGSARAPMRG